MNLETLISAIARRGKDSLGSLTAVSNNAGAGDGGLAKLTQSGQVTRLILSYLGSNKDLERKYLTGEIAIELCPQGTLAERIRAAGAGIPAFFTPTGVREFLPIIRSGVTALTSAKDTFIQTGQIPARLGPKDKETQKSAVLESGKPRETRVFDGRTFVMETALKGDVAILRAWKVDESGNCQFR